MNLLMKTFMSLLCLALEGTSGRWILKHRRRGYTDDERFLAWLTGLMPFAYGGYYTICAAVAGSLLLFRLIRNGRKQHEIRLYLNLSSVGIAAVVLGYCLSVFWAVNHGMALYGIAKHLPLLFYALLIMQNGNDARQSEMQTGHILTLLPFSGSLMVLCALVLQFVPGFSEAQVIGGRLAGFFEYPNTMALFLMLGIGVLVLEPERQHSAWRTAELLILVAGVFESGSRIGFALLALEILILCLMLRRRRTIFLLTGVLAAGIGLSLLLGRLESLAALSRYTTSAQETSSLLTRLLYYRDALPVILKHPFGLGYWGYASARKLFQHGVYSVVHVHNDLLQLLLDIGWIPAVLFCAGLCRSFFSRRTGGLPRLLLFLIAAYCMFEFHLSYLSVWLILLACLHLQEGRCLVIHPRQVCRAAGMVLSGCALLLSLWLGTGEALSTAGYRQAATVLTPVYTPALARLLSKTEDSMLRQQYAEKLARLDPCNAEAWSVLAETAWDTGEPEEALALQERVITCSPYELEAYLDDFDMLDALKQQYEAAGDTEQAASCREQLLEIPERLQQVLDTTDPIAWKIQHTPELTLPEKYKARLAALQKEADGESSGTGA